MARIVKPHVVTRIAQKYRPRYLLNVTNNLMVSGMLDQTATEVKAMKTLGW